MKRILAFVLTVLFVCSLSAMAETSPYTAIQDALYRIVLRTEAGDETLGSGVLFMQDNILLTAEGCCREGDLYAIGEDGEHAIRVWKKAGDSGLALMEMRTASDAAPLTLANYDKQTLPYVFGTDAAGNTGAVPLYEMLYALYRDQYALTLSGEEGLMPGGVVIDEGGNLVALVVAQQMEGIGMYIALEPDAIYNALNSSMTGGADNAYLPLTFDWSDGVLTVSWTDGARTDGVYALYLAAEENYYYNTFHIPAEESQASLVVAPGHTYYVQVEWASSADATLGLNWNTMTTYTVPVQQLDVYDFRQDCYLAIAPAGQEVEEVLEKPAALTVELLTDAGNGLYLQVLNTYDVSEVIELPMSVSLTAPDGQFYYEEMGYTFAPEYETADNFAVPVDELFAACRDFSGGGSLPTGTYTLSYAIGGMAAGECTFTVEAGQ